MSHAYLVRHPAPFPTESLLGYVLRLTEVNGYASPNDVLRLADISVRKITRRNLNVDKLAAIANQPVSHLDGIAFSGATGRSRARLLLHEVAENDINLPKAKLCPQCVAEKGFIEAHWHLKLMVACPVHRRYALSACPKCGERLSWLRPGLLVCKCGGSLLQPDGPSNTSISQAEADLLEVVRRKMLGCQASETGSALLPQVELDAMSLPSVLRLVRSIGRHRLIASGLTDQMDNQQVIAGAADVLTDWPINFHKMLNELSDRIPKDSAGGITKELGGIYQGLLRRKRGISTECEFVRTAFVEFVAIRSRGGYVDPRFLMGLKDKLPNILMTQSAAAAELGAGMSMISRMVNSKLLPAKRAKHGSLSRILVDPNLVGILRLRPNGISGESHQTRLMGIPREKMNAWRSKANCLQPSRAGERKLDQEQWKHLVNENLRIPKTGKSPRDAAMRLHCDRKAIPGLVSLGLLTGSNTGSSLRITDDSIEVFNQEYIALAWIAASENTSTEKLVRLCNENGIDRLLPPTKRKKVPQPFIRVADKESLMGMLCGRDTSSLAGLDVSAIVVDSGSLDMPALVNA
jgi:hypothetical protein